MAFIPIENLPLEIDLREATLLCHHDTVDGILDAIEAGQSALVECDKLLVNYLIAALRERNRSRDRQTSLEIVDHRVGEHGPVADTASALSGAIRSFGEKVSAADGKSCAIIVPNFDLLVSADQTASHLDVTTRDMLALLHENPDLVIVAFKDTNLNVPKTVLSFFPKRFEIFGTDRVFLDRLVTQAEARRIDPARFDPYQLYKYVSGLNLVRLRKIMQGFATGRYSDGSGPWILDEIRRSTLSDAEAELPNVDFESIGGYGRVKAILKDEVLGLLRFIQEKAGSSSAAELRKYEKLVPRNILFSGPPGTGKTTFCKALATSLNATVFIVNGPELKSKWVGESEWAIRNVFARARKCAPSLIVFDEIDSFARRRAEDGGAGQSGEGNGHDNSMLNQLLTEMDGFRPEEMVFTVATTNLASSLDTALLSRFKTRIEIPYPDAGDRREIMGCYDEKYGLGLSADVLGEIVSGTELWVDQNLWTRFAGRDLEAIASSLARRRLMRAYGSGVDAASIPVTVEEARDEVLSRIRTKPSATRFDDIGGYAEVKERLSGEILGILKRAKDLPHAERLAIEKLIPKGVIFEGPPGTGKTMFAKAFANELGMTVSVVNGPELKGSYVGETESRIRKVFSEARKNAPSVVVFDEFDSIASDRAESSAGGFQRSMVNQLLTEMDGMNESGLVFVIATTNFAKSLDRALRRPGRFEYVIEIPYPDPEARREIFSIYNRKYGLGLDGASVDHLVFRTENWVDPEQGIRFSGDHIEAICRSIARRKFIDPSWEPTKDGLDRAVAQRTKKPLDVAPEEEAVIAAHEAGHAIVSMHTEGCRPIRKISIASEYDGSLGYVLHGDAPNKFIQNREELLAEICCLLGGRAAERRLVGKVATGGANDIEKATLIATHLVASFGMDEKIGSRMVMHPLIHGPKAAGCASPGLLALVDEGVDRVIREQDERAEKCLAEHWDEYNRLRETLIAEKAVEF